MLYKDLDSNLKRKLSGCNSAEDIVKDFLRYGLSKDKESGTYEYMDNKTFKYIKLDNELVEDLVKVLKESQRCRW